MQYRQLGEAPVPTWGAVATDRRQTPTWAGPVIDAMRDGATAFRGVGLGRLATILRCGIDVEPSHATMYVGSFDKAWEYGDLPKVVMAFAWDGLSPTFRSLPVETPTDRVDALRADYPHEYRVNDRIWLSRIEDPNPARRSYELAYARWIPGNPFDALRALFVYGAAKDLSMAESLLR